MALDARRRFSALPTAAKLLILLTAALLPIGLVLVAVAQHGIDQASLAIRADAQEQARSTARAIESLIARNSLALRIATNGALRTGEEANSCAVASRSLAVAPAVAQSFTIGSPNGALLCSSGSFPISRADPLVAPGDIRLWIAPENNSIFFRVGVVGGMGTGVLSVDELRRAAQSASDSLDELVISDGLNRLPIILDERPAGGDHMLETNATLAGGQLTTTSRTRLPRLTLVEQLLLLLPVLMWASAALISWLAVNRLLIKPLRQLQRSVADYQPGAQGLALPPNLGPATEIQELGEALRRSIERLHESEHQMAIALEGQRRLVREVHHRVKNNLQVIASLLSIHGRNAPSAEARSAYAAIGRRVDALAVVHRNHFAELEETRGIALRPLLTELAAGLRASAPDEARGVTIVLDVDDLRTTQDAAVAAAFLVTEIVESAMLSSPTEPIEIELRRVGELHARLALSSAVLIPEKQGRAGQGHFERILAGLAKQLRSPLERKLGRYSVELPVFPA